MLHELFQLLIAGDGISAVRLFRSAVSCKVVLLHSFQRFWAVTGFQLRGDWHWISHISIS